MKIVILALIPIVILYPDNSVHAADGGKSVEPKEVTVTLDIKKTQENNDYNYHWDKDTVTFRPKGNKLFSKIVSKNSEVWSSKDSDYAREVLVKGKYSGKKDLEITLKSGKLVKLHKEVVNRKILKLNDGVNAAQYSQNSTGQARLRGN
ncbi:hypothetical protein TpMuguga_04g00104 [Theileria parva strain Muguga]|uniref:Uncharacterized protein n=1 Tax=Theileria parva TaxID=5875 RepID=Q4N383_THEPA|nr:uncharacterized protein TpMuguga_04g00104 [Theileria parva strain Muguga]EAN31456.1 hypothetical protein TpMuguga_04g00104 [Theileria parva strain Muguga]|eukprot:XP_763739.1 hypothetical protein [Theileria parva strain Muguga]